MISVYCRRGPCLSEPKVFSRQETTHDRGHAAHILTSGASRHRATESAGPHGFGDADRGRRHLILTGLAGGDNKALAERLMHIERRLAALESLARELSESGRSITAVASDLRTKFDALLSALSSAEGTA
jgi:hypothetical protein